ncbi:MAG: PKD domain-containing protein [Methanomicrobiales archaeon]|nr:PKD domain-containing protein [Methanomicrobiales archaeon]
MVHADQALVEIQPIVLDRNVSLIDYPGIITGGGKGYYLVHSNVEGADVYFNNDWHEGKIVNGTLLVETCLSCTPVWTYTVKKCGYLSLKQNNTRYPGQDEVIDLYANLTSPREPLIADFNSNVTTGTVPFAVGFTSHSIGVVETWNWSFGDGTYSDEKSPVHIYTSKGAYTVSLVETNSACQNSTKVKKDYITAGNAPQNTFLADFTVSPVAGIAPLTVKCTDKSTGKPTLLVYDFGDGTNVTGPNPTHTYRFPGIYSITLSIMKYNTTTNSIMGSVATKPGVITVGSVPFIQPVAKFRASPVTGKAPLKVTFTDQSIGSPIFYSYNFGDGIYGTGKDQVHTYQFPGTYTVTLTVMKNNAANASMVASSSVQKDLIVVTNLPEPPVTICNQPYGLCTIAKCEPLESDPTKAICNCFVENGVSAGLTSCGERQPIGMYQSATGGWMISAGALFGKITSTYSFINSLPKDEGKIPNRYIDPNYTGNLILKSCNNPVWADCLDMKCVVPSANPLDNISVDHKAADYAVCECEMVRDNPLYYMATSGGEESCTDPGLCGQYIWSAAYIDKTNAGIKALKAYLAAHPNQDPAQQYTMPICEACGNKT